MMLARIAMGNSAPLRSFHPLHENLACRQIGTKEAASSDLGFAFAPFNLLVGDAIPPS
jgi:hypothetical protein